MRKTIYFAAIFVALAFVFTGCGKKTAGPAGVEDQKADSTSVEEFQATIEEMARSGKPYQCDYSVNDENGKQVGTLYFAGENNFRGDVKITMADTGDQTTHFIKDGETQYIWTDGQTTGMKITITKEEEAKMKEDAAQNKQQGVDMNTKADLRCKKWSPDKAIMTPPGNIKFQSLDEMMQAVTGGAFGAGAGAEEGSAGGSVDGGPGTSLNADDINMCSICEKMPVGAARNSCMQSNCE
ncbi:MAG: hypothetical protein NTW66_02980 [Candidatus Magasanikbacteria bacterium]|nr:hypothetical protein [Candidatus Magasanikbacteria bacterium]